MTIPAAKEISDVASRLGADLAHLIISSRAEHVPSVAIAESVRKSLAVIRTGFGNVCDEAAAAELQNQVVAACSAELERTRGHVLCRENEIEH